MARSTANSARSTRRSSNGGKNKPTNPRGRAAPKANARKDDPRQALESGEPRLTGRRSARE
jgi:hypothetical protein